MTSAVNKVKGEGIFLGDRLRLSPFGESQRTIILKKPRYFFKNSKNKTFYREGDTFYFPRVKSKDFHFMLRLYDEGENEDQYQQRYVFECLKEQFFSYNKNKVSKALISHCGSIDFGYNQLRFYKKDLINKEIDPDIPSEITDEIVKSDINIHLSGETGVGKGFLAKKIHEQSQRLGRFVQINLSSFSPSLIESELFGHMKGSFTGALRNRDGAIAEAHNGTLFLDEIDSLPVNLQTKLLLFLDHKTYRMVGGYGERKSNARLIFASGRSLDDLVAKENFRKDLYYRINSGICVLIRPLRDQKESLKRLLDNFCVKNDINYSSRLLSYYQSLLWPGNIRQFLSHLEKKKILCGRGYFDLADEDFMLTQEPCTTDYFIQQEAQRVIPLRQLESRYVHRVYNKFDRRIDLTSKALKVAPGTVKKRLNSFEYSLEKSA